jgi:hypothetical protein
MATKKPTIAEVLGKFRPRELVVSLCLAGDLVAEHAQLDAELSALKSWAPTGLGDTDPRKQIADRIAQLEDQMKAAEVEFRFRAVSRLAWSDLLAAHPPRKDRKEQVFNADGFEPALLAACCVDPVMTVDQAAELLGMVSDGQAATLFTGGWTVNEEQTPVPFSLAASAVRGSTAAR